MVGRCNLVRRDHRLPRADAWGGDAGDLPAQAGAACDPSEGPRRVSGTILSSASGGVVESGRTAGWRLRLSVTGAIIAGAVAVALALRFYQLTRPGYLLGVTEYDDGPYFGSAVRLLTGSLPYRD